MQLCSGLLMFWMSWRVDLLLAPATINVYTLSAIFFVLILLAATQDIAVDGWALTILSKENRSLAATCQTVGLNIGFFSSFTVFLAFNSADFCNSYLRFTPQPEGLLDLGDYLQFWAIVYLVFTGWLIFFKEESKSIADDERPIALRQAYQQTVLLACRPRK